MEENGGGTLKNPAPTVCFLQKFVEENGGGGGIAEFNQVFNGSSSNRTLPSGGSWLVFKISSRSYSGSNGNYFSFDISIEPGGYTYGGRSESESSSYSYYMQAVRIA